MQAACEASGHDKVRSLRDVQFFFGKHVSAPSSKFARDLNAAYSFIRHLAPAAIDAKVHKFVGEVSGLREHQMDCVTHDEVLNEDDGPDQVDPHVLHEAHSLPEVGVPRGAAAAPRRQDRGRGHRQEPASVRSSDCCSQTDVDLSNTLVIPSDKALLVESITEVAHGDEEFLVQLQSRLAGAGATSEIVVAKNAEVQTDDILCLSQYELDGYVADSSSSLASTLTTHFEAKMERSYAKLHSMVDNMKAGGLGCTERPAASAVAPPSADKRAARVLAPRRNKR